MYRATITSIVQGTILSDVGPIYYPIVHIDYDYSANGDDRLLISNLNKLQFPPITLLHRPQYPYGGPTFHILRQNLTIAYHRYTDYIVDIEGVRNRYYVSSGDALVYTSPLFVTSDGVYFLNQNSSVPLNPMSHNAVSMPPDVRSNHRIDFLAEARQYDYPASTVWSDCIVSNPTADPPSFGIIDLNVLYSGWDLGTLNDSYDMWECQINSDTITVGNNKKALFLSGSPTPSTDPYAPGGTSGTGGGGGTFDDNSDQIVDSPIQSISLVDTGFARVYNPTLSQVKDLARYVWTDDNFLQTLINKIKARIENPIDSIISLSLLPCPIPNGTAEEVKVVYVPTGVMMPPASSQFVEVDCGSVNLTEYYGSALDYSPYTKVQAYLPYIGQVTLDTDEIMGNTLNIKYRIDIVTGICVAKIFVNGSIMYQFNGHCAINMPLSSTDFSSYFGAFLNLAKGAGAIIAAGTGNPGIAAGILGMPGSSQTTTAKTITREGGGMVRTERNPSTGRQITSGTTTSKPVSIDINETTERHSMSYGEMAARTTSNTVSSVMASKTIVEHSGSFSGNSGVLAVRRPYLIIERPRMCRPDKYGILTGFPSMMAVNLGDLTGYTEVQNIHLTNFHGALNPETGEIAELLKAGVVL